MDLRRVYADTRGRITELVSELGEEASVRMVPACPDWTIADLVAHLAGILADIRAGNLDGVASDPWTARQVAERRGRRMPELLDEWNDHAPVIEQAIPSFPPSGAEQLCADIHTHEQDIRGALGRPGMRAGEAFGNAIEFFSGWLRGGLTREGIGLRVEAGDHRWENESPKTTLTADGFELLRAYSGRRSADQIRAFDWDGDPEPFLALMSPFGLRSQPLVE